MHGRVSSSSGALHVWQSVCGFELGYAIYILHYAYYLLHFPMLTEGNFQMGTSQEIKVNLKLRAARAAIGITQQDLADSIGATRQTIGLIENGLFNPSLKLCLSISHAVNKTLDDLFWDEESDERGGIKK